jgi:hypothetical protein
MPVASKVAKGVAKVAGKVAAKVETAAAKRTAQRGAKATMKSTAKKTVAAAPKKPRPKYKDYKWDAGDYGMAALSPIALGTELIVNVDQAKQLERNRAMAEQARKSGKPIGADKFGWAGRR